MARQSFFAALQGLKPLRFKPLNVAAKQAAEKLKILSF
jgi:hypothetical protein